MEKEIIKLIETKGPLTGSQVWDGVGGDGLAVWRTCRLSKALSIVTVGVQYLRLDRRVQGYARLSPSLFRQFLTYSVVGLPGEPNLLKGAARRLSVHIDAVSKNKLDLAYRIASGLEAHFENEKGLEDRACFVIAGDIVHNMAHDVPRPERSTGKMVNGSDMDLVVILEDGCSEDLQRRLDEAIYEEKVRLLIAPHLKEEIDYVVKRMGRVREQVRFNTFKRMTACKILQEGTLLYGSEAIFHRVKTLLRDSGVTKQLLELEQRARSFRQEAEAVLLAEHPDEIMGERLNLFYPSEESDEFE